MVQTVLRMALGTLCGFVLISPTLGQSTDYGNTSRPTLSPYLNQLRRVNPAVNYYFGVASRNDRRPAQLGPPASVETKVNATAPAFNAQVVDPAVTGHGVQFMNCAPYFQLNNGARSNARAMQRR